MSKLDFVICRILGGEMPPRDVPGERVKALVWILANEPRFPNATNYWLLNNVVDSELLTRYMGALNAIDANYGVKRLSDAYRAGLPFYEKVRLAIDINGARNQCIETGRQLARFTVVLDGDCFFTQANWDMFAATVRENQAGPNPVKYFSTPTQRMLPGDPGQPVSTGLTEAMLTFRDDAELRFDESRRFGDSPKQELLWRLGHSRERDRSQVLIMPGQCVSAGVVHHYAHGKAAELDHDQRGCLRQLGLEHLLQRLDKRFP